MRPAGLLNLQKSAAGNDDGEAMLRRARPTWQQSLAILQGMS